MVNKNAQRQTRSIQLTAKTGLFGLVKFLLVAATMFVSVSICSAAGGTVYFAQGSAGANNGSSCANAIALSAVTWTGGNTYHLCGTITSQVAPTSGSAGNPVTLLFETGAMIKETACGSTGCINLNGRSYVIVDGSPNATPCGYVSGVDVPCNGTIQATGNGTGSGSSDSVGVFAKGGGTHIEVRNLNIINMYVHTPVEDAPNVNTYAIWFDGSNNLIHNNIIHDTPCGVCEEASGSANSIYSNQIYNSNWGVFMSGAPSVNSITNIAVYSNDIHDFANWDTPNDDYHHDGLFVSGNTTNTDISHIDIYDNYLHGTTSSPSVCASVSSCMTAYAYINTDNHVRLFNNVFSLNQGDPGPANGAILMYVDDSDSLYNNTIMGGGVNGNNSNCVVLENGTNFTFENNVVSSCPVLLWTNSATFASVNNNIYQNPSSLGLYWRNGTTYYTSLSAWQSVSGEGSSSVGTTGTLGLTSGLLSSVGSIVLKAASNLTGLSIAALDVDKVGTQRPSSGAWDAGAYQSGSASAQQPPAAPTGLFATVQ